MMQMSHAPPPSHTFPTAPALYGSKQWFARINPALPKGSPENVGIPALERFGPEARRFFHKQQGFVPIDDKLVPILRQYHADGETTARGGQGPHLFDLAIGEDARRIVEEEQRRTLLSSSGSSSLMHAELRAAVGAEQSEIQARMDQEVIAARALATEAAARADALEAKIGAQGATVARLEDLLRVLVDRLPAAIAEAAPASAASGSGSAAKPVAIVSSSPKAENEVVGTPVRATESESAAKPVDFAELVRQEEEAAAAGRT